MEGGVGWEVARSRQIACIQEGVLGGVLEQWAPSTSESGPIYMQSLVTLLLYSFVQNYPPPGLRVIKYAVHALQARKSCPAFYNWQVTINASGFSSVI